MVSMGDGDVMPTKRWVDSWRKAGPRLEEIRRRELRSVNTTQALMNLAGAFESCRLHFKPSPTSGLVAQQRYFKALRP
jgi:hypothetical protein